MTAIERGQVWLEKPCAATRRRGYARRVIVESAPAYRTLGRVTLVPAPEMPSRRTRILESDFLRRFTLVDAPTVEEWRQAQAGATP